MLDESESNHDLRKLLDRAKKLREEMKRLELEQQKVADAVRTLLETRRSQNVA